MEKFLNKGRRLEIFVFDPMNYRAANEFIQTFKETLKLPTIADLEAIYEQQINGEIILPKELYWSSSEFSDDAAWYLNFMTGLDGTATKILAMNVIAVRELDEQSIDEANNEIIVFGDIHGCSDAAETAIALAREKSTRAIFLGDYIDRGPSSIETIQLLIQAKRGNLRWIGFLDQFNQKLSLLCNEGGLGGDS
jgi:uncharacterized protein YegP (UPF0339 family)